MQQGETLFVRLLFKPFLLAILFCFGGAGLYAQENCANGVDDDGNGLVDLRDPACQCHWKAPYNLLLNPSFEEYKHCITPNAPYVDNYDIALHWLYGVRQRVQISFYSNLSCPDDSIQYITNYVPRPIPDGTAFLQMNRAVVGAMYNVPESTVTKYYVAQCLQTPLVKGGDYTFSFYGAAYLNNLVTKFGLDSFAVAVFGNTDCNAVPFGEWDRGNGCPANYPGWVMLGKTTFVSPYKWVQAKMKLTIPENINVIEVGTDCSLVYWGDTTQGGNSASKPYYYLDDFQLAETKAFNFQYITVQGGNPCDGGYILKAPVTAGAAYQWYQDSIALVGQTDSILHIPGNTGSAYYNVRVMTDTSCQISEPLQVNRSLLGQVQIPADTFLCKGGILRLGRALPGVTYNWSGKQDTAVTITQTGNYTITAADNFGCRRVFNVQVDFNDCAACQIFVPGAFTPNGDGKNDVLKAHSNCPVTEFNLQVYSRWGQKIFETSNIGTGWDGTYMGRSLPGGAYIYMVRFKSGAGQKSYNTAKGTVVIMR